MQCYRAILNETGRCTNVRPDDSQLTYIYTTISVIYALFKFLSDVSVNNYYSYHTNDIRIYTLSIYSVFNYRRISFETANITCKLAYNVLKRNDVK